MSEQSILVINAGSSSIKFALYSNQRPLGTTLCSDQVSSTLFVIPTDEELMIARHCLVFM